MQRINPHEQPRRLRDVTDGNPYLVARNVSFEEYMKQYAAHFAEWIDGEIIKLSPVHDRYDEITQYLLRLFGAYFERQTTQSQFKLAPFLMRLDALSTAREPDAQITLGDNVDNHHPTYMGGPADIAIEIVSPESVQRD